MTRQPGATAPTVFISYRREDSAGHAGRLYDAVAARFGEDKVFMDVELAPGIDFVDRITQAVAGCDALLVVIGPRWATVTKEGERPRLSDAEDYVRLEVETGLGRPDLTVIPVLVAGARMPASEDLPESLRGLKRLNAIDLSDARWRYDAGRLVNTLAGEVEKTAETPAEQRRQTGLLALGAGLVVAIVLAALAIGGVFSSGGGGGGGTGAGASTSSNSSNNSTPNAEALTHKYETFYEARDLDGLRSIMAPDIVLKKGNTFQRNGVDQVISEYRRELDQFGKRRPGFDWDETGSDASEEIAEVHGGYQITADGANQKTGKFGTLTRSIGGKAVITELCFDCPDLRRSDGFLAAGSGG
jgi:hypothetical protein